MLLNYENNYSSIINEKLQQNTIGFARKIIKDSLREDEHFKFSYISAVACLLSDLEILEDNYQLRNEIAEKIIDRIFFDESW